MKFGAWKVDDVDQLLPAPTALGARYAEPAAHGTMRLGYYAPRGNDPQRPHEQDELYIIQSGTGEFFCDGRSTSFGPGDVLFVAARVEHRFEEFTEDFSAWVVFWGPPGGEISEPGPG